MIEAADRFSESTQVIGFDWYEKSMEGKLIPEGYFETFQPKILAKDYHEDDRYEREKEVLNINLRMRIDLVKGSTPAEVNDGKYDLATKIYYAQLEYLLKDTEYEGIMTSYRERDKHISQNIIDTIESNRGKKLAFIMGCDHRVAAVEAVKKEFGDSVKLVPVS